MAKFETGIRGAFSGKIGTVVGASWRGIAYGRSLPLRSNKPPSPAQLNQRLKFALVMAWLRSLLDLVNIGFQADGGGKTPINRAVSYHLTAAVTGSASNYEIDFKNAIFSRGELMASWILALEGMANAVLHVKWDDSVSTPFCRETDKATFVVYNLDRCAFVTFGDAQQRIDKAANLQLPQSFTGDLVHIWMLYIAADGKAVSTTAYLGSLRV